MDCPKCGYTRPDENASCEMCGIVFSRFLENELHQSLGGAYSPIGVAGAVKDEDDAPPSILIPDRKALINLAIAAGIVLLAFLFTPLKMIFNVFATLLHELGHSLTAWVFGYPSIPAFDLMHGGGIAVWFAREPFLIVLYFLAMIGLGYLAFRKRRYSVIIAIGIIAALYSVFAFTSLHDIAMVFMGHGGELLFGGIFLFRALSGAAIVSPFERPLYGALGIFFFLRNIVMGVKLITSEEFRYLYTTAKGDTMVMDLNILAEDYFSTSLTSMAGMFVGACVIALVLTLVVYMFWPYIRHYLRKAILE